MWWPLIDQAGSLILRPQYCAPLNQTWPTQSNITLLGDDDLQSAIAAYEYGMRTRAASTAKITLDSMVALHSATASGFMAKLLT